MGYEYGPSENAIVINTTSQLLRQLGSKFGTSAILAPTRREENDLGYDIDAQDLLGVVLQFKRPSVVKAMRQPSRISKPAARFSVNTDQLLTLRGGFGVDQAFFALSPLHSSSTLHKALERSVFVDVFGLPASTSKLYTACDCCTSGSKPLVEGLVRNGTKFSVPDWYVYCMDEFKDRIDSYHVGIRMKEGGRRTQDLYYVEERLAGFSNTDTEEITRLLSRHSSNWAEMFPEQDAKFYGFAPEFDEFDLDLSYQKYDIAKRFMDESVDCVPSNIEKLTLDINREKERTREEDREFHPMNFILQRAKADFCLFGENKDERA